MIRYTNTLMKSTKFFSLLIAALSLLTMSFSGCGTSRDAAVNGNNAAVQKTAPDWVSNRPASPGYYIGIGSCSKIAQPLDYQVVAKKNALNDLATEISVRVQGQTFLNSLEINKNFSEEFISTISTTTDEKVENYEVAGIWENDKEFWIFYKLNRSEYQRQKQAKKNQAMASANDYYLKGKTAESLGNVTVAFDLYMRGLFAMKEYWDEVNEFQTENGKVFLDNEIYSSMQQLVNGLSIKSPVQKVVLSSENKFNQDVPVGVTFNGKNVKGITLVYKYARETYMKPKTIVTNDEGAGYINVSKVSSSEKSNNLDLAIDLEQMKAADLDEDIQDGLIKTLKAERKLIPIELAMPSFYIRSKESRFGKETEQKVLASALSAELVKRNMRISSSADETNYLVDITSNTIDGGYCQGFMVAFLEMKVEVKNARTGETVFTESISSIKGLQMNIQAADIEAYKNGKSKIEEQIIPSLMNAIM